MEGSRILFHGSSSEIIFLRNFCILLWYSCEQTVNSMSTRITLSMKERLHGAFITLNPFLAPDFLMRIRKDWLFFRIVRWLFVLSAFLSLTWIGLESRTGARFLSSQTILVTLTFIYGIALVSLIALFAGSQINYERERDTLGVLLAAPMTLGRILRGKVFSCILLAWYSTGFLLPLYGIVLIRDDISYLQWLSVLFFLSELSLFAGYVSLCFSIQCKRVVYSICASLICLFLYVFLCLVPYGLGDTSFFVSPLSLLSNYAVLVVLFYCNSLPYELILPLMYSIGFVFLFLLLHNVCTIYFKRRKEGGFPPCFILTMGSLLFIELRHSWLYRTFVPSTETHIADRLNPIFWKEQRRFATHYAVFIGLLVPVVFFLTCYLLYAHTFFINENNLYQRKFQVNELLQYWPLLLVPFLTLPYALFAFVNDWSELRTHLLPLALLRPGQIVRGKLLAGMSVFNLLFACVITPILFVGLFDNGKDIPLRFDPPLFSVVTLAGYVSALFYFLWGFALSTCALAGRRMISIGLSAALVLIHCGIFYPIVIEPESGLFFTVFLPLVSLRHLFGVYTNYVSYHVNLTWMDVYTWHLTWKLICAFCLYWLTVWNVKKRMYGESQF